MGAAGTETEKTDLEDHEEVEVEVEEEVVLSPVRARCGGHEGGDEDEDAAPQSLIPSPRLLLPLPVSSSSFCCSFWFTCSSIAAVNDNRDKSNCNIVLCNLQRLAVGLIIDSQEVRAMKIEPPNARNIPIQSTP